jgi:hypothetical protein
MTFLGGHEFTGRFAGIGQVNLGVFRFGRPMGEVLCILASKPRLGKHEYQRNGNIAPVGRLFNLTHNSR